jgi:hypothetical protein
MLGDDLLILLNTVSNLRRVVINWPSLLTSSFDFVDVNRLNVRCFINHIQIGEKEKN